MLLFIYIQSQHSTFSSYCIQMICFAWIFCRRALKMERTHRSTDWVHSKSEDLVPTMWTLACDASPTWTTCLSLLQIALNLLSSGSLQQGMIDGSKDLSYASYILSSFLIFTYV